MLHAELLREVGGLSGQGGLGLSQRSLELRLEGGLLLLDDGGAEGQQLLIAAEIALRLAPELRAEPLGLLAAGIDGEELQQALKIPHLGREILAEIERQGDEMPQGLRLREGIFLLLGDQVEEGPDEPVVIGGVGLEERLQQVLPLRQHRQDRFLQRLDRRDQGGERLQGDAVFHGEAFADALHGIGDVGRLPKAALQDKIEFQHGIEGG